MTPSGEVSELESGFNDESEIESSTAPTQTSQSTSDALSSRWCIEDILDIYSEGMQRNE